jgi:hypothetical protein
MFHLDSLRLFLFDEFGHTFQHNASLKISQLDVNGQLLVFQISALQKHLPYNTESKLINGEFQHRSEL